MKIILHFDVKGETLVEAQSPMEVLKQVAIEAVDFLGEGHLHSVQPGETLRVSFDVIPAQE